MGAAAVEREGTAATYEIRLQGAPPETLMARFAHQEVRRTAPQTVLMRRVTSQDELADLLERVITMGLVLDEVRELRTASVPRADTSATGTRREAHRAYEVRVAGALDPPLLRYLGWQHRLVPELAAMSVEGTPEHLHEFLSACCRLGLGLEQVRRLQPVEHRERTAAR